MDLIDAGSSKAAGVNHQSSRTADDDLVPRIYPRQPIPEYTGSGLTIASYLLALVVVVGAIGTIAFILTAR